MNKNCIFCQIANGQIEAKKLYENEEFVCFLDANPNTFGHCLVIPKAHYENIYEIPSDVLARLIVLVKKIAIKLKSVTKCDGMNIFQNNELAGNQTIFHYHCHIRPRYNTDNIKPCYPTINIEEEDKESLVEAFQDFKE